MALGLVVLITALLIPEQTNRAFATAVNFVNAAGNGEDDAALALTGEVLGRYVANQCPQGSIAACIDAYIPDEWGDFLNAIFRRAQPDGPNAWDVQVLATYAEDQGFSGVCIYTRVERDPQATEETWAVTRWSGWVSCDLPEAGLSTLRSRSAPNAAP